MESVCVKAGVRWAWCIVSRYIRAAPGTILLHLEYLQRPLQESQTVPLAQGPADDVVLMQLC